MRRAYFLILAIFTLIVLAFSLPGVSLSFEFATFGFGAFALLPLPMGWVVFFSVAPLMAFWNRASLRLPLIFLAPCLVALVSLLPMKLADLGAVRDLERRGTVHASELHLPKPIGVEIRRLASAGLQQSLFGLNICDELCERLLTGGDVAWVRSVFKDGSHALFVRGTLELCQTLVPGEPSPDQCVVFDKENGLRPDIVIEISESSTPGPVHPLAPYQTTGSLAAKGFLLTLGSEQPFFHVGQIHYLRPVLLIFNSGVFNTRDIGGGFMFERVPSSTPPLNLVAELRATGLAMGLGRSKWSDGNGASSSREPDVQDAIYVASLSNVVENQNITPSGVFLSFVDDWQRRLRSKKEIDSADIAAFCLVSKNKNFTKLTSTERVIQRFGLNCS